MKTDILITWPRSFDFPLWRQMIHDNRERFGQIVIVFMETNYGYNYREFVRLAMSYEGIHFLESPIIKDTDWRDIAVKFGLTYLATQLHSHYVWFTEQDFFPADNYFEKVQELMDREVDYIGVMDEGRLHPCSLHMSYKALSETRRSFGIVSGKLDHFGQIQEDIERLEMQGKILPEKLYNHMAGLTHNMSLVERGQPVTYKPQEFADYMKKCFEVSVPIDTKFADVYKSYMK